MALPGDPKFTLPGFALACATSSGSVRGLNFGETTITSGTVSTCAIGARSLNGS